MKARLQTLSACALLASGVALSVAGFCVSPIGEISDSVLWYFAQTLIYAGSIFGVSSYINVKFEEYKKK
ncbi:MAG: hypothetical protein IIW46_05960 [Bacteroidaceae bacterium]|nr:hypothetical protein [Bacteroidaceae bacterium]